MKILTALLAVPVMTFAQVAEIAQIQAPADTTASIDIAVTAEPGYVSWQELSTSTERSQHSYFTQRGNIHLKIKEDAWIFNVRMDYLALGGASLLPAPLSRIPTRYPQPGSDIFVSYANMDYAGHALHRPLRFKAGLIPMEFGSGMVLSDNGLGIFGAEVDWENLLGSLDFKFISGNTESSSSPLEKNAFHLGSLTLERMGKWNFGYLYETDQSARQMAQGTTRGKSRRRTGLLYYTREMENFTFNMEGALTEGSYVSGGPSPARTSVRSSAFAVEGGWLTHLPKLERLGPVDFSFMYSQGSGDDSKTTADESFFAPMAKRFDGLQRTGHGELLSPSTYDALSSSNTWNGLPQGLSGISTFGFGFKTQSHKIFGIPMQLTFDRYLYRASQSDEGQPKSLGGEWDFGALFESSDRFKGRLVYYLFDADKAYDVHGDGIKSISGVKASFSLAFK